jgi:hypothetical protein
MNSIERPLFRSSLLAITLLVVLACGGTTEEPVVEESSSAPVSSQGELPSGHPPLEPGASGGMIAPPPPGSGAGAAGLVWTAPAGWVEEAPANRMRKAQYRVGAEGICVVYYFGPGEGGDAQSNAARWADQFDQPDGRSSREVMAFERFEVAGTPVTLVEVTGTYNEGMMGGEANAHPDFMLLGAIAEGPDANWFFKLTGPENTLNEEKAAFRGMIDSLRRGG